ncbi:probable G-protein coupled receptor No9 [Ischnura elegans]|uniref:probable G-protein coupled receptor No9 n=1 Tax=Ischnura elegans TaxID=197161 RepID=UPI001ED86BE5|nr:probable G-protein coupled receptor No9 [Ischnura elegans]
MNATSCDALASRVRWDSPAQMASLALLGAIDALVVAGNVLVIAAVFVSSKLRGAVTNLFIASLAAADLLLGVAVLPFSATWQVFDEVWLFGDAWCSVWLAVDVWLCTASILNLCAISLDRYVAVTRPVAYPSIMSSKRAKALIGAVWALSFLICFPPLVGWNDGAATPTNATASVACPWVCELTSDAGYVLYSALGSFFLPMFVMLFFYWRIYRAAVRTTRAINQGFRTTKGSKVLGSFGSGTSFGRFDDHRLTLRIHRGRGSVLHHGCTPEASPPPRARRLVRSRTQDRIPGAEGGRRGGSCRASPAAALASAASSAAGTALFSVGRGAGGRASSSPPPGRASPPPSERRPSSARFDGSHTHLLRVSSASSSNSGCATALQRSQSARHPRSSGCEAELSVPGASPASSPTTYESVSVSSATAGEGGSSPVNGGKQRQRRNSSGGQHVSRMGKRNIKAQVKRFRMETKAAKTLGVIVGGFVFCWLPFFTAYVVRAFCEHCTPPLLFSILFWLGYCNSAINPCIYALFSKDFRFAFKRIICRCFCAGRGEADGGSWGAGSFRGRSGRARGAGAKRRRPPAWLLATSWARRPSFGGGPSLGGPSPDDSEDPPQPTAPANPPHHNGHVEVIVTSDSR